jgi:hypothetical protein
MKTLTSIILVLFLGLNIATAQDTVYIYQSGSVVYKRAIVSVDSVIFYQSQSQSKTLTIGQSYQGGIIAYILQPGDPGYSSSVQHGLIAAPSDQSTGIQWYNGSYITTGATRTAIGTGMANTNAIIVAQGTGSYAASICKAYNGGGYSDWYLPSLNELNKLFLKKNKIGGFSNYFYWSSTEIGNYDAWGQYFYDGSQNINNKLYAGSVRAVRAF